MVFYISFTDLNAVLSKKTFNFINRLNSVIYGIRDGKQISYKEFATLKLWYPPIEEQKAIASVFNESDDEIKLQYEYLESLKSQKIF